MRDARQAPPPRGDYVRPLSVIRAEQRLALARVLQAHGSPDYDCILLLLQGQRRPPSSDVALRLLRWWHAAGRR